jgi:2,3-bisphosphoglycerate-dependent phosphoglycerate mutase
MSKLILLRHFKSQWNLENRFTGWTDVPVSLEGKEKVEEIADKIAGIKIDVAYTSPLIRNMESCLLLLRRGERYPIFKHFKSKMEKWGNFKELNGKYLPVFVNENLNERYYGELQGFDKAEVMAKYGEKLVHFWRRSFKKAPPKGESLADVVKRVKPLFKNIEKDLLQGKNVLVVASHNSLRALIKEIEKISDDDIINLEVPYAGLTQYEFERGVYKKINSY